MSTTLGAPSPAVSRARALAAIAIPLGPAPSTASVGMIARITSPRACVPNMGLNMRWPGRKSMEGHPTEGESMKTKAAVVYEPGKRIEIEELELDKPQAGEVLIRYLYAGL